MRPRIVVARLDKVGDTVLSTPFFYNLRRAFPDHDVIAVVKAYNADVLGNNPDVDSVEIVDAGHRPHLEKVAIAVALSPTAETYRLVAATRAPRRWGIVYSGRLLARLQTLRQLTDRTVVDVDGALRKGRPVPHEVRQMLQVLEQQGIKTEEVPLRVFPTAADRTAADGAIPAGPLMGVHLSVRWFTDGWTLEDVDGLIRWLLEEFPRHRLLVTYGSLEADYARRLPRRERVHVLGNLEFGAWAALIGRCHGYVSTDTGALHVAAAMGVPLVAVYEGATFNHCSQQWAPWMVRHEVVRKSGPAATHEAIGLGLARLLSIRSR